MAPVGDDSFIKETLPVLKGDYDFSETYLRRKAFWYKPHQLLREYKPFIDCPDIHFEVANENIGEAYVDRFVRKYGLLLQNASGGVIAKGENKGKGEALCHYVDVYSDYKKYLKDIQNIAWLLSQLADSEFVFKEDAIAGGKLTASLKFSDLNHKNMALAKRVIWHDERCILFFPSGLSEAIEWQGSRIEGIEKGNLHKLFKCYIAKKANDYLSQHTAMCIEKNCINDNFEPSFMPKNLLGAIWIMIHNDFLGGLQTLKCECCGVTFSTRDKSRGNARKFCSNACKMAAYRNRKLSK